MSQELVISSNPIQTTVAIVEDGRLVEICVEQHDQKALGGSIFKGRVTRVLSGMQSAFVDLGLERDAFLYVTDVLDSSDDIEEDPDARLVQPDSIVPIPSDEEPDASDASDAADPDAEGSADWAGASDEAADDTSIRPRRRSRRRRRSPRRDDAPDTGNGAGPPEEPPLPVNTEFHKAVLPGESIAKYRNRRSVEDKSPATPGVSGADHDTKTVAPSEPEDPGDSAPRSADMSGGDAETAEPSPGGEAPRLSASVNPTSTVAEFRLRDWLKDKLSGSTESKAKPRAEPKAESKAEPHPARGRKRSSRRRPSKPRSASSAPSSPAPSSPGQPAKSRPARRTRSAGRATGRRSRTASRRSEMPERARQTSPQANIDDLLQVGQELVVQVNKEPVGTKGARITSHVTLPGRYMVYMATAKHNGVARAIHPESERTRLRKIVDKQSEGKEGGFVVRTAGRGISEDILVADMDFLHQQWTDLKTKAEKRKAPANLHTDLDIVERILRDNLGENYSSIWVDSEAEHERIVRFVKRHQPELEDRVKLHKGAKPIHESFGIKKDLERALRPKVWLKSGGYIVIEQTEALVAIDVNTGRYVGKSNRLEDTVLKTNLEAAEEILRQIRLRDLGGIIVLDFIDMEDRKNRQSVYQVLQEALRKSRSPSRLLPFNDFGLVAITRKSVRQSLERALLMPCPSCSGAGKVKSPTTVISEIFDAAGRVASKSDNNKGKRMTLRVHPEIAKSLKKRRAYHLEELETFVGSEVVLRSDPSMHPERFTLA